MASGNDTSRAKAVFSVQGQSLHLKKDGVEATAAWAEESSTTPVAAPSVGAAFPFSPESEAESVAGSDDMVSQVMAINRTLVQQIDALRLRLEIDYKHHESSRNTIVAETDEKLRSKSSELNGLKTRLKDKEEIVHDLSKENERKSSEIAALQNQIEDLRRDVADAKMYAEEMQTEVTMLQRDKGKLQNGTAYKEKDEEIQNLQSEIYHLNRNLNRLERELTKAKEIIAQQGSKIRFMESDKKSLQIKFKEELNKVTQSMRLEIEKLRDVMRNQWQEMRELREQNESMRADIKEIREMLAGDNSLFSSSDKKVESPKTTTGFTSSYNVGAFKPSHRALSKDTKRVVQGKKNRV